eukprot:37747-Hanusia_phi.AAC.1
MNNWFTSRQEEGGGREGATSMSSLNRSLTAVRSSTTCGHDEDAGGMGTIAMHLDLSCKRLLCHHTARQHLEFELKQLTCMALRIRFCRSCRNTILTQPEGSEKPTTTRNRSWASCRA